MAASSRVRAGLGLCICLAAALPASAEAPAPIQSVLLYVIPTRVDEGIDLERPLRVALHADDPAALSEALGSGAVHEGDRVIVDLRQPPAPVPGDPARYRSATFLADFEDPAVAALAERAAGRFGPAPGVSELVVFVRETIEPSLSRGFDLASQVAVHRQGDCTEHAVLFAALARRFGHATRIASGTVLVVLGGELQAFGHAWNEVHDGEGWRTVDPTDLGEARALAYLADGRFEDEGPSYGLELIGRVVGRSLTLVEVLGYAGDD